MIALKELKSASWVYLTLAVNSVLFGLFGIAGSSGPKLSVIQSVLNSFIVLLFAIVYRKEILPALKIVNLKKTVLLFLIATVLIFICMFIYFWVFQLVGFKIDRITKSFLEAKMPFWLLVVTVSILPGIFEEIAFRGVIFAKLKSFLTTKEVLIIQAAAFSALHISPLIFISHFAMGLIFGWLRIQSQSLFPGMLLHALWNYFVIWTEIHGSRIL